MGDIPVLKPREVTAILERLGFDEVRQKGSHKQFRHAEDRATPFESWIVDQFICCEVGDQRSEVVRTALGENERFPVRHVITLDILEGEAAPDLFGRLI